MKEKKVKISEYSLFKRVNNNGENYYYNAGSILVSRSNKEYYDLINKRKVELFDQSNLSDGYEGIMFEKDETYYKNQIYQTIFTFKRQCLCEIEKIIDYLKENRIHDYIIEEKIAYLKKLSIKDNHFLVIINSLIQYLKSKRIDYGYIISRLQVILNNYKYSNNVYLKYKINAELLQDLNRFSLARLNMKKSIMLYAENNNMIYEQKENLSNLNRAI